MNSGESKPLGEKPLHEAQHDSAERLKEAFEEYVSSHLGATSAREKKPKYRAQDWFWIAVLLIGLLLAGSLIPEGIFKDERYEPGIARRSKSVSANMTLPDPDRSGVARQLFFVVISQIPLCRARVTVVGNVLAIPGSRGAGGAKPLLVALGE